MESSRIGVVQNLLTLSLFACMNSVQRLTVYYFDNRSFSSSKQLQFLSVQVCKIMTDIVCGSLVQQLLQGASASALLPH